MDSLTVIASAWRWNLTGLACCVVLLALYLSLAGLHPSRSLAWYLSGVSLLAAVVCSPLDILARQYLLTAEAVEQILIALVVTYLLVKGLPAGAVRRLHVSYPLAWTAGMLAVLIWYFPRLLDAALTSEAARCLEYASLLVCGAAFWYPLHAPLREQRIPLAPHALLYLAAATAWCSLAGIFVAFGHTVSSAHYIKAADTLHIADSLLNDWSFSRETDQETAGLLFWIGSATVLLTEVMLVYYRWYNAPEAPHSRNPAIMPGAQGTQLR
ncbi:MAG TPA: cytochrome c oxidase assembly protein [Bryobacteraceae bacterium]|nr:cytochrome c oxidase assembly protein [Bryobacteraceae bacterium]